MNNYREEQTGEGRLILSLNVQLIIENMCTKYEVTILNGFRDIFDEKLQY